MFRTCESRWFLHPDHPSVALLEASFAGLDPERTATDRYLVTGRDDVGIKVRDGGKPGARLEMKLRQGALGPIALGPCATGAGDEPGRVAATVELWSKAVATEGSDLEGERAWIEVAKERRLRRWAVRGDVVEERSATEGEIASQVELCRLRRDGARWITFGVETHGDRGDLVGAHLAVLRRALAGVGDVELRAADAVGYPAWLQRAR